jgi:hypothetical protein
MADIQLNEHEQEVFDRIAARRKRDETATKLTAASVARKNAEAAERTAKAEYEAACVNYGKLEGHPLAYKNVKRSTVRKGSYDIGFRGGRNPDRTVTERGVVTLAGAGRVSYRGHHPKPGEWFVLSASGHTAYALSDEWEQGE